MSSTRFDDDRHRRKRSRRQRDEEMSAECGEPHGAWGIDRFHTNTHTTSISAALCSTPSFTLLPCAPCRDTLRNPEPSEAKARRVDATTRTADKGQLQQRQQQLQFTSTGCHGVCGSSSIFWCILSQVDKINYQYNWRMDGRMSQHPHPFDGTALEVECKALNGKTHEGIYTHSTHALIIPTLITESIAIMKWTHSQTTLYTVVK